MKLPSIRRLNLLGIFELLVNSNVEIILGNGLSYRGKLIKAFDLDSGSVYIHLLDERGFRHIIKVDDATVITKEKE